VTAPAGNFDRAFEFVGRMQRRVPCDGVVELADLERQRAGLCAPFAPDSCAAGRAESCLAIDVDAVEAAAFKCAPTI